eukprot:TRINITY_DN22928_c0_g1_i2.p1 TRINITY_DN22928_c0_g1~~TRINITY_DN22928_c0_g1_i2.p1  ORF type:complete len:275 (-),score=50.33 TRINITY_DN22928_c0_g1_i2:141-965(-)
MNISGGGAMARAAVILAVIASASCVGVNGSHDECDGNVHLQTKVGKQEVQHDASMGSQKVEASKQRQQMVKQQEIETLGQPCVVAGADFECFKLQDESGILPETDMLIDLTSFGPQRVAAAGPQKRNVTAAVRQAVERHYQALRLLPTHSKANDELANEPSQLILRYRVDGMELDKKLLDKMIGGSGGPGNTSVAFKLEVIARLSFEDGKDKELVRKNRDFDLDAESYEKLNINERELGISELSQLANADSSQVFAGLNGSLSATAESRVDRMS